MAISDGRGAKVALAVAQSEAELVGLALALGAADAGGLTAREIALARRFAPPVTAVGRVRERISAGEDPLGDALMTLRSPSERRTLGAIYTPPELVRSMTAWAAGRDPERVIDPGAGSGRFLIAAGRALPNAELVAVDTDPMATLLARANLAVHGFARRARVVNGDFRRLRLPARRGPSAFLGNPPYVRHHDLRPVDKRWLTESARRLGLRASGLAGLHVHFFLAAARQARPGDFGAFVTASEWLDVNYGSVVRALFLEQLGGVALHLIAPQARPFADADTTAVIACFAVGERPATIRFRTLGSSARLGVLGGGQPLPRARLAHSSRWSSLMRPASERPRGYVELGELFAVHRGQVTGDNATWVLATDASELPERVRFPTVTRAKELLVAGPVLRDLSQLRRVLDLPADLDQLLPAERRRIEAFLRAAERRGVHRGFIARHRRAWWAVGLRAPAPILATYMARRPPVFVENPKGARHINIAHGLYPRGPIPAPLLATLTRYLNGHTSVADGRTYAGGLTKFEPREMERLLVPGLELLG
jgi:adenine-specific DNA-methyltransferase